MNATVTEITEIRSHQNQSSFEHLPSWKLENDTPTPRPIQLSYFLYVCGKLLRIFALDPSMSSLYQLLSYAFKSDRQRRREPHQDPEEIFAYDCYHAIIDSKLSSTN